MRLRRKDHGSGKAIGDSRSAIDITGYAGDYTSFQITGQYAGRTLTEPADEGTSLPIAQSPTPIIGYKRAGLVHFPLGNFRLVNNTWRWAGSYRSLVETEEHAKCVGGIGGLLYETGHKNHSAPALECQCGFYAVTDPALLRYESFGPIDLEVELRGRIIVHERGYRAQHQRVLRATMRCWWCGELATAVGLTENVAHGQTEAVPVCPTHKIAHDIVIPAHRVTETLAPIPVDWGWGTDA